jgi:type II secretory pathway pseudopilin PulG
MFSFREERLRGRAVTLVEVLVATALVAVIGGLILTMLLETRKGALRGQNELALQSEARAIADGIRSVLEAAVAPGSLDAGASTQTLQFSPETCTIISSKDFNGRDFYLSTIRNVRDTESGRSRVELATGVLAAERTPVARETERTLGVDAKEFSSSVRFEYATTLEQAMELKPYAARLAPGEYPRVIRIRVNVGKVAKPAPAHGEKPIELMTAVRLL